MYIDVHAHLDQCDEAVIQRAEQEGVVSIIAAGVDKKSNRAVLALAQKYDIVKAALGIHPADGMKELHDIASEIEFIRSHANDIIAISEIGLDHHWVKEENNRDVQKITFKKFLHLAVEIKKPVIIHSRAARQDVIDILDKYSGLTIVLHAFEGNKKMLAHVAKKGWYCSVPSSIVRSEQLQMMTHEMPLNLLLTETDSPVLSPVRDTKNEPKNVILAVKKIAEIKGITEEECRYVIYMNYQKVFL